MNRLHGESSTDDQVSFLRSIVLGYLATCKTSRPLPKVSGSGKRVCVPQSVKTDATGHYLTRIDRKAKEMQAVPQESAKVVCEM